MTQKYKDTEAKILMDEYIQLMDEIRILRRTIFDYPESEHATQTEKIAATKQEMLKIRKKVRAFPSYLIKDVELRGMFEREAPQVRDTFLFAYD